MNNKITLERLNQKCPITDQELYKDEETGKLYTISEWDDLTTPLHPEIFEKIKELCKYYPNKI